MTWLTIRSALLSLFLPLARVGVFLLYYGVFFDGSWTFKDDWTYLERGQALLEQGVSVTNLFAHLPELFSTAGGKHFVFYLFNADAFRFFGADYYAPVALNIVLTFVAAGFMVAAARAGLDVPRRLAKALFAVIVLYPDVVAWSTIMNGKDTLVTTGTAMAAYAVSQTGVGHYWRAVTLGVLIGFVLFFTRFYVPLMMLLALVSALMFSPTGGRRIGLWVLALTGLASVLSVLGVAGLVDALSRLEEGWVSPLYGVPRYLLTPIPFNTTDKYSFLDLPQMLYWLLMPFMLYGMYRVWRRATLTARFVILYFVGMVLLYAMFGNLQGPRHRYQLDLFIVLFQLLGLVSVLHQMGISHVAVLRSGMRANSARTGAGT